LPSVKELLKKAIELKNEEQYEKAIEILEELYKANPKAENIRNTLIDVLFTYGGYLNDDYILEFSKAAQCFKRIIEIDSTNYRAHYNLGIAYFNMGMLDEALKSCNIAIDIKSDYKHCYYNIGLIYETKEDLNRALEYYQKALEIDPNYIYAYQAAKDIEQKLNILKKSTSEEKLKKDNIGRLKSLLEMSKRIEIVVIQDLLGISKPQLIEFLISWGKNFQCELDGNYLNINKNSLPKLLKELDNLG